MRLFLTAIRFERATTGKPIIIAGGVLIGAERSIGDFSTSSNGMLLFRQDARHTAKLAWYGRDGKVTGEPAGLRTDRDVSLSHDGKRLSTVELDPDQANSELWLYELGQESRIRLTSSPETEYSPLWSRDGEALYFTKEVEDKLQLYRQAPNAASSASILAEHREWFAVTDTSQRDGM